MRWEKRGLVFEVIKAGIPWMRSHAQVPIADHISGDLYRVYFASRSEDQISRIGWVVVDLGTSMRLLEIGTSPVLEPGDIGTFDEHGVFPSCIVNSDNGKLLYYIGWNKGYRAPLFYASIGLAISTDGGQSWQKCSSAPILSRSKHDPCLVTSPHVLWHSGRFRMTYVSGIRWKQVSGTLKSYYHIKYADSVDGVEWNRDGRIVIDFADESESNVGRSWVVQGAKRCHMWFGYVRDGGSYRMGYAHSLDFLTWVRDDRAAGIDVSTSGWDSEMICYPSIVTHGGCAFMFYNGNRFGKDGFGVAVREATFD